VYYDRCKITNNYVKPVVLKEIIVMYSIGKYRYDLVVYRTPGGQVYYINMENISV